jgi:hypothetical protein
MHLTLLCILERRGKQGSAPLIPHRDFHSKYPFTTLTVRPNGYPRHRVKHSPVQCAARCIYSMASPARLVRKIPEELIKAFEEHKLETTHQDDRKVVHKIGSSEWVWKKKQRIGVGASGSVWLQEKEGAGELRAVKILARNPLIDPCHSQEILALVKLEAVSIRASILQSSNI